MKRLKWAGSIFAVGAALLAVVWFADFGGRGSAEAQNLGAPAAPLRVSGSAASDTLESLIAQKSGLTVDTITKIEAAVLAVASDKGTAAGVITADQAAKLQPGTVSPILNNVFAGAAKAAGVSGADLFAALVGGQSLAQVALAHGVDAATLKARLTTVVQDQVAAAQAGGLLTAAQAGPASLMLTSQMDKVINLSHQPGTKAH